VRKRKQKRNQMFKRAGGIFTKAAEHANIENKKQVKVS
jgi:hypothetical protein